MDFLEQNYMTYLEEQRQGKVYKFRDRHCETLLNDLGEQEFRKTFRFSKQGVRDIAAILHDNLG